MISIQELLGLINEFLYSNILIALLVATGVYFTIRTKFVQFRMLPEGVEMVMPGDNVELTVELIAPIAIEKGTKFSIREGGRTVGSGNISDIIE